MTKTLLIICKQLRPLHWVKNLILFLPGFFAGSIFEFSFILNLIPAFITFSLAASLVYTINDLKDLDEDKQHPYKQKRPLASGELKASTAFILIFLLLTAILILLLFIAKASFSYITFAYILINLLYSFYLKKVPYIDIISVCLLYILRMEAGAVVSGIIISRWLFVTVFFGSLILVTGKRYAEFRNVRTRSVLNYYSAKGLKNIITSATMAAMLAYLGYVFSQDHIYFFSFIIFFLFLTRYNILVLKKTAALERPESILFTDRYLLICIALLVLFALWQVYF